MQDLHPELDVEGLNHHQPHSHCHSRTSCDLGHVKYKDENRIELYSLSVRERDSDEAMR